MNTCKGKQKRKTMNFPKGRVNVKGIKMCMSELKGHNSLRLRIGNHMCIDYFTKENKKCIPSLVKWENKCSYRIMSRRTSNKIAQ